MALPRCGADLTRSASPRAAWPCEPRAARRGRGGGRGGAGFELRGRRGAAAHDSTRAGSPELVGPLLDRFTEETGINVGVRYGGTAQLRRPAHRGGRPEPGLTVFISQDAGALGAVQAAGLFATIDDDILERVAPGVPLTRGRLGRALRACARDRLQHRRARPLGAPRTRSSSFTDPKWRGRVAWAPTNGSFQAWVTALRVSEGEDGARAWLEGMLANDPAGVPEQRLDRRCSGSR